MKFLDCGTTPIGLYPVVDRTDKLKPLYESGVTTTQLRVKDLTGVELENEIIEAIKISKEYNARLFINDFWLLAIKHNAYGIHLGQEDILEANIQAIHDANIRLGISTHTTDEIKIALDIEPSYVAIGPVFETQTKEMVYEPVGISRLKQWSETVDYPIVAIAGIKLHNIKEVVETNCVNGVAMITGVLDENEVSISKTEALVKAFNASYKQ
ncbi:MAG: thiamine phosphate synthase [Campylobacteraceae bacterium]|jgi:thiamine-phosphate pyrophosphorylase/hydroxymethylpyrimidine kinase/phosphomethylpyrimidine kinase/thiamine-phosphate diphosphorylase|nr:thiamine phosphate synthase [Campylobacteraceae bacterium]MBT4029881.1 thiamine phosphate synthase [Campylobacteraceae bacterium]MBT4179299.1 thiamine phosphate synthase [Campylobacteraceae bacterium]MBT4572446.1 thiamine phosphate synthase [Campylobacteraceae bacterium]MBT4708578.1 thiamine phosphate synthase [Campylobacteraceae bacterium]